MDQVQLLSSFVSRAAKPSGAAKETDAAEPSGRRFTGDELTDDDEFSIETFLPLYKRRDLSVGGCTAC